MREKARTGSSGWSTTMIVGFAVVFAGLVGRASPAATSSGFRLDWSYSADRFGLDLESAVPESSLVPGYLESPQRSSPRIELQADQPPVPVPLPVRRPDPQSLPLLFASDLRALLMAPAQFDRKAWRNVGLAVGLIGAVSLFDDEIHGGVRYDSRPATTTFAQRIRPLGREASLALLGGAWIAGRSTGNPRLQSIGRDGLEASLLAGFLSEGLKAVVGRSRPRSSAESLSFSSSGESFPSGEATQAFVLASVVSAHTEKRWLKGIAWSLAAATAWQRMELDAHWASDVAAGALLGAAVGRWVVRRHRPPGRLVPQWSVAPQLGHESAGLMVVVSR